MLVTAWGRTYNLPYVIVRPTNNYGMGQYVEKLIPKALKYLKLGKKIPLHNKVLQLELGFMLKIQPMLL
jgi:dTDP-glucose 4,6-dehydratase